MNLDWLIISKIVELHDYILKSAVGELVNKITFEIRDGKVSASEIIFSDWKKAVQILSNSPQFIQAGLGYLHNAELGESSYDFRSLVGNNSLGNQSLQINIGVTTGKARADLDKFNPAQDIFSFIGHTLEVLQIF